MAFREYVKLFLSLYMSTSETALAAIFKKKNIPGFGVLFDFDPNEPRSPVARECFLLLATPASSRLCISSDDSAGWLKYVGRIERELS